MCQRMFDEEIFPKEFQETTLYMLFKGGKGQKNILENNRFIHCKEWWPRVAEGLILEDGLKDPLIAQSSIYQVGEQPGHRSEELLFVLKSVVARTREMGKMVVLQSYDISKFFNKELIEDAILTCIKRGAYPRATRLWYKLNANTRIQVKTGVGVTRFGEVGAVVGQGMLAGALVSQAVLDDGVMEHLTPGGELQMEHGDVPLAPLMWMDDVMNSADSLEKASEVNQKVNVLLKQRGLSLNKKKSVCIIIGSKKQKEIASKKLETNPLMCGDFQTKEKVEDKWLGQIISSSGLAESVAQTVASKENKIKGACLEIAIIVNDWRAQVVGGFETALMLWEACCIPSMLHGAGTWVQINTATENRLNALQNWFVRLALRIGQGSPVASLLWDTLLLDMSIRVWREKIMMVIHLRGLDETTLGRRIYEEQKKNNWPGLAKETKTICESLNIEDCNITQIGKSKYRKYVTQACHTLNEERLRKKATGIKCARIASEGYGRKSYIKEKNISDTRDHFRARFGLTAFAGNYSHDQQYSKSNWLCQCQQSTETESHIMSGTCKVYGDLIQDFGDLHEDSNLVSFFKAVLDRRDFLEEEEQFCVSDTLGASSVPGLPGIRTRRPGDPDFRAD